MKNQPRLSLKDEHYFLLLNYLLNDDYNPVVVVVEIVEAETAVAVVVDIEVELVEEVAVFVVLLYSIYLGYVYNKMCYE